MNTYLKSPLFVKKLQAVVLSASLVLVSFLPAFAFPQKAGADADPVSSYIITGLANVVGQTLNLNGTSAGNPQKAEDNTQHMAVDWDEDNNASTTVWVTDSTIGGPTFTPIFSNCYTHSTCFEDTNWTASHDYSALGGGTYHVKAIVYHGNTTGNDGSDLSTISFTIVIPPTTGGLLVKKVLDNTGGGTAATSSFSFAVNAGSPVSFESDGQNDFTLSAGPYSVVETVVSHYTPGYSNCSGTIIVGATTTCTITNTFFNNAPVVQNLSIVTDEDTASSTVLSGSDTDLDSILYALLSSPNPLSGLLSGFISATGAITFTPTLNFNGADSFTYEASDAYANSNIGTVTLTVNPVNDPPVANDDSASTNEDTPVTTSSVLTNDTDVDLDTLSVLAVDSTSANGGTVVDNTDGTFTYTPALDYSGSDTFNYTVSDGSLTDVGTVTITVSSTNDAPVAVADSYSTNEDTALNEPADGVLTNDSDTDSDPLTAILVTDVSFGSLTLNADGSFDYTPAADYNGPDSFTYKVNDGSVDGNTVTVSITVEPQNDAPVAVGQSISTSQNIPLPGVLGASDVDGDSLTYATTSSPTNGTLTLFNPASGAFTYTPNTGFSGSDSFDFKANDGSLDSNTASISITVNSSPECSDTVNNDGDEDSLIDSADPGCWTDPNDSETYDPEDNDETTPEDVCLDDEGIQTSTEDCTEPPVDVCPNIDGLQVSVPDGKEIVDGQCVDITSTPEPETPPVHRTQGQFNRPQGSVLGASTIGQVLGESCGLYMDRFVRRGRNNDVGQVMKLQTFLNKWMNAGLPITGFYGPLTNASLNAFQTKYASEVLTPWGLTGPTGIAYLTTLRQINMLECPDLALQLPPLVNWSQNPNVPR